MNTFQISCFLAVAEHLNFARAAEQLRGAHEALLSMGFTAAEADLALKGAPEGVSDSAVLQYALNRLGPER